MRFVMYFWFTALLVVCLPLVCYGNNAEKNTLQGYGLEELIQIALENNPQLQVAKSKILGHEGVVTQTRSAYLPHLKFDGDLGRQHVVADELYDVDEDNVIHTGISASQLLVDFGNTLGAMSASSSRLEAALADYQNVGSLVVLLVKNHYYKYLEQTLLIQVAEEQVANYRRHLVRAEEFLKHGIRTPVDVSSAKVELSDSKLVLRQRQYDQKVALLELKKVVGVRPKSDEYRVHVDKIDVENLTQNLPPLPSAPDDLLVLAVEQRPDLKRVKRLLKAANEDVKSVKGRYWPSLSAIASTHNFETDIVELRDNWQVGVVLNWDIFSGLKTDGEMAEAKASVRRFQFELRDIELNANLEVNASYLNAEEQEGNVLLAGEIVDLAKDYLRLADERYQSGLGDVIEYNDAQFRLSEARGNLVVSYVNYLVALAEVEKAVGTIPNSLRLPH